MRIGIDARMLGGGYGIGRYIEQFILHLAKIDQENEYVLFVRDSGEGNYNLQPTTYKLVQADIPWYGWEEQIKFTKIIKLEKVDLMHFPHWNVPLLYNDPFVVTIHDLTMYHYPRPEVTTLGPVKFWIKYKVHRLVIQHAVRVAQKIIVTSEFTKGDVHTTLGVSLEKMMVTYQAPFENQISNIKNKKFDFETHGICKPYVLYVGASYPHKNLDGLVKAWKIFEEKYGSDYQLVLVGKENYFYDQLINNETMKQCNNIVYTGFVPDSELFVLYQNASLYAFPSLYEGFGLPPLEAMAHGVPVVSSNRSCLPEVLGEAALYFDPENYEQMADVIHAGLTDDNVRFELKQAANRELRRYSWDILAKQTLGVYKKITD